MTSHPQGLCIPPMTEAVDFGWDDMAELAVVAERFLASLTGQVRPRGVP
jgi:hypothetical protein